MLNALKRSLHTKLPPGLKFSFELTHELFNSVFLIKVQIKSKEFESDMFHLYL